MDLDFKNAFNSVRQSVVLEGFGVPDVSLLSSIYENCTMRIQVGSKSSAGIQLDTETVWLALSPLLFDLFINTLLRLSTLLAFPIVYEVSPIGIIRPLPTIFRSMSAQRKTPTPCWTL